MNASASEWDLLSGFDLIHHAGRDVFRVNRKLLEAGRDAVEGAVESAFEDGTELEHVDGLGWVVVLPGESFTAADAGDPPTEAPTAAPPGYEWVFDDDGPYLRPIEAGQPAPVLRPPPSQPGWRWQRHPERGWSLRPPPAVASAVAGPVAAPAQDAGLAPPEAPATGRVVEPAPPDHAAEPEVQPAPSKLAPPDPAAEPEVQPAPAAAPVPPPAEPEQPVEPEREAAEPSPPPPAVPAEPVGPEREAAEPSPPPPAVPAEPVGPEREAAEPSPPAPGVPVEPVGPEREAAEPSLPAPGVPVEPVGPERERELAGPVPSVPAAVVEPVAPVHEPQPTGPLPVAPVREPEREPAEPPAVAAEPEPPRDPAEPAPMPADPMPAPAGPLPIPPAPLPPAPASPQPAAAAPPTAPPAPPSAPPAPPKPVSPLRPPSPEAPARPLPPPSPEAPARPRPAPQPLTPPPPAAPKPRPDRAPAGPPAQAAPGGAGLGLRPGRPAPARAATPRRAPATVVTATRPRRSRLLDLAGLALIVAAIGIGVMLLLRPSGDAGPPDGNVAAEIETIARLLGVDAGDLAAAISPHDSLTLPGSPAANRADPLLEIVGSALVLVDLADAEAAAVGGAVAGDPAAGQYMVLILELAGGVPPAGASHRFALLNTDGSTVQPIPPNDIDGRSRLALRAGYEFDDGARTVTAIFGSASPDSRAFGGRFGRYVMVGVPRDALPADTVFGQASAGPEYRFSPPYPIG